MLGEVMIRKFYFIIHFSFLSINLFSQRLPRIAYLPLISDTMTGNETMALINMMEEELVKSEYFELIPHELVREIADEMIVDLSLSDTINLSRAANMIGIFLISDYVLFSDFIREGRKIYIRANLIEVETAEILTTIVIEADDNTNLKNIVRQTVVDAVYTHFDRDYTTGEDTGKLAICVMDLEAKNGVSDDEASIITTFVIDSIYRFSENRFTVIDIHKRDQALAEHQFTLTGLTADSQTAIEIGNFIEANYMIFGGFMLFGSSYYISLNVVDVETTEVLGSLREKCATLDDVEPSVDYLVRELLLMIE